MSLGSAHLWFTALQCGRAFVRTARGLCTPVDFLLVSALRLFSLCLKKLKALEGVGYFSLMGVTLSISMAVGVLTDCAVGMCLAGKNYGSDVFICYFVYQIY